MELRNKTMVTKVECIKLLDFYIKHGMTEAFTKRRQRASDYTNCLMCFNDVWIWISFYFNNLDFLWN